MTWTKIKASLTARQCRRQGLDPWSRKILSCPRATKPMPPTLEPAVQSLRAASTESMCPSYWSLHALETLLCNKRGHRQSEAHAPPLENSPWLSQLEKSAGNEDPAQLKKKKKLLWILSPNLQVEGNDNTYFKWLWWRLNETIREM